METLYMMIGAGITLSIVLFVLMYIGNEAHLVFESWHTSVISRVVFLIAAPFTYIFTGKVKL
jgi:hypothetical protein